MQHPTGKVPRSVALIAAGPTQAEWLKLLSASAIEGPMVDEVWGIKTVGRCLKCDVTFSMDDAARYRGHNPSLLRFFETADHPIITSVARPNCPTAIPFPLGDVLAIPGARGDYLNHTVAYAIAYAIALGVKELLIFGADYISSDKPYDTGGVQQTGAARYLACAAYWIGQAEARGMQVIVCPTSPLLDADVPFDHRFYGYLIKPFIKREQVERVEEEPAALKVAAE